MSKYSDIKTNLDIHPTKGDLVLLTDEDAVKRSIKNLLLTHVGERPYDNIELGSGLDDMLFENITPEFEIVVSDQIKRTIKNYEPRAIVQEVSVKADEDNNSYSAMISFNTRNLPTRTTLSVILSRIR